MPIADINRLEQAWVGSAPSPGALAYEPSVEARLQAILQSRSWRATAPLRAATTEFRLWRAWFAERVNLPIRDQLRALIALIGNFSAISKIRSNELFAGRAARPEGPIPSGLVTSGHSRAAILGGVPVRACGAAVRHG